MFLPEWFPTKMPWVHRGIVALITKQTDWLLDFGPEVWRDEVAEWTVGDLEKILTNFVVEVSPEEKLNGAVVREAVVLPLFSIVEVDGTPRVAILAEEKIGVMMPRGFSKTTLINSVNLRDTCYQNEKFLMYVSEAQTHSEAQLSTVKKQLAENELLRVVFGDQVPGRQHPNKWTEDYIEPLNGTMAAAVGSGGQVRGKSKNAQRPTRIVVDDFQDEDSVQSDKQRAKDLKWFIGTLSPATAKGGRIIAIGTMLHEDAVMPTLGKSPEWTCVRFAAIDRQGDPLWAWQMDRDAIEAKRNAMASVGQLQAFYMEYMSEIYTDASSMFPPSKIIHIGKGYDVFIGMGLALDPAISEAPGADFVAFGVVGVEANGAKHIVDCVTEKGMDPAAQVDKFFELHYRHLCRLPAEARKHGIEAIGYQRSLIHLVKGEQFRRSHTPVGETPPLGMNAYFDVTPIFHGKTGKLARVQGILKPLLMSGYLTFDRVFPELENQLLVWPGGKKDAPDVIAMAVTLLDPYAAAALGIDGAAGLTRDSAPPIDKVINMAAFRGAP